jgi:tryptophanase
MISDEIEMIEGDEAYAGSKSSHQLEQKTQDLR